MGELRMNEKEKLNQEIMDILLTQINEATEEVNERRKTEKKEIFIKDSRYIFAFIKLIYPYLLSLFVLNFLSFKLLGIPFKLDDKKKFLYKQTMFDNYGNLLKETQYYPYDQMDNTLYYYSSWEEDIESKQYKRTIKKYSVKLHSERELYNIFREDNINLEELFGDPLIISTQTKNKLSEEEKQENHEILEAHIFNLDRHNYLLVKESVFNDLKTTLIEIVENIIAFYGIKRMRCFYSFKAEIKKIDDEYNRNNLNTLSRKLELRKSNYEILCGDNHGK